MIKQFYKLKKILFVLVIAFFISGGKYLKGIPDEFFDDFVVLRNNLYFEKFSNEPLNGSFEQYWPNGQLHKIAHFNLGVLDGLAEEYLDDGRLLNQLLFKDGNFVESQTINYFDKSFDEFWLYGYEEEEIKKIKKKLFVFNVTRDDKVLSVQANTYSKCGFLVGKINTVLNIPEPFEQNTLVPKDDTINNIGESYNT